MKPIIDEDRFTCSPSGNSPSVGQKDSHLSLQFVQGENIYSQLSLSGHSLSLTPVYSGQQIWSLPNCTCISVTWTHSPKRTVASVPRVAALERVDFKWKKERKKERKKDMIINLFPPFEKKWRLSGLNHMGSSFNDNYVSCLVLCSFQGSL